MFNLNITMYDKVGFESKSSDNGLKKKVQLMEEVVNCVLKDNFQTNKNDILKVYLCTMSRLKEEIGDALNVMKIEMKKKSLTHIGELQTNIIKSNKNLQTKTSFYGLYVYY